MMAIMGRIGALVARLNRTHEKSMRGERKINIGALPLADSYPPEGSHLTTSDLTLTRVSFRFGAVKSGSQWGN